MVNNPLINTLSIYKFIHICPRSRGNRVAHFHPIQSCRPGTARVRSRENRILLERCERPWSSSLLHFSFFSFVAIAGAFVQTHLKKRTLYAVVGERFVRMEDALRRRTNARYAQETLSTNERTLGARGERTTSTKQ